MNTFLFSLDNYIYFISSILLWLIVAITISPRKIIYFMNRNKYKILLAGIISIIFGIVITVLLWNYPLNLATSNVSVILAILYFIGSILLEIGFPFASIALFIFISTTLIYRKL